MSNSKGPRKWKWGDEMTQEEKEEIKNKQEKVIQEIYDGAKNSEEILKIMQNFEDSFEKIGGDSDIRITVRKIHNLIVESVENLLDFSSEEENHELLKLELTGFNQIISNTLSYRREEQMLTGLFLEINKLISSLNGNETETIEGVRHSVKLIMFTNI